MNAMAREWVPILWLAIASLALAACGEHSNERSVSTTAVPPTPLVVAPHDEPQSGDNSQEIVTNAGGVAARYTPTFEGEMLVSIEERREVAGVPSRTGTYRFQGARLMRYEGAALNDAGALSLEFDLQGKVIAALHESAPATDEQISAIRTRAQLLRNHALAQRVSRTHATGQPLATGH